MKASYHLISLLKYAVIASSFMFTLQGNAKVQVVGNIDELTQQWLDMEVSRSELATHWKEEKQQLTLRISLLQEQNKLLRKSIKTQDHSGDQVAEQRESLLKKQIEIEKSLAAYRKALPNIQAQLQSLIAQSPSYLQQELLIQYHTLTTEEQITEQYKAVANIIKNYLKADELQQVKQSLVTLEGEEVFADILYLGNDQAWFVTKDNSRAGLGFRDREGWQWQWLSQHQHDVRQAITRARGEIPGELIQLPVKLGAM